MLIEDRGSGTSLLQELRYSLGCSVIPIEPTGEKTLRVSAHSSPIEAGRVFLPHWAPWLKELQREVLQFPSGKFDDQLDSIAQFLGWWEQRQRSGGVQKVKLGGV